MGKRDREVVGGIFFLISKKIILKSTREQRQHKGYREGNKKTKEKKRKKQKHKKINKD